MERALFLGIILLFTSGFISSSPANIPVKDARDRQDVDTDHVANEIKKSVDEKQENKGSKLTGLFKAAGVKPTSSTGLIIAAGHISFALTNELSFYLFRC